MREVGAAKQDWDAAELAVFVDRLAAAGTDRPTKLAQAQIRATIGEGAHPPGLLRLVEGLAAAASQLPMPRPPAEVSIAASMRDNALVVFENADAVAVAGAVAALLSDGRRVVVTATSPAELTAVRRALPAGLTDRALTRFPVLVPAELRELRKLLATSTPERRARVGQELPPPSVLPPAAEVAELCALAEACPDEIGVGARMVAVALADLDEFRRNAVTSLAHCVSRSLQALPPRAEREWVWQMLSSLIYTRNRPTFDRMIADTAQAAAAVDRARYRPPVEFTNVPPPGALDELRRYRDFLAAGGRTRSLFRSSAQREVQPVLDLALIGNRPASSEEDLRRIIEHLELAERWTRIEAGCVELGLPVPRDDHELFELADVLVKVAAAARSLGALRHDVLFLSPGSPLSVPDVESAEELARAILDLAEHGSPAAAAERLDAHADALAAFASATSTAPEHRQAVAALRARDAAAYAAALDTLDAARREVRDEKLRAALLERLSEGSPALAEAWDSLARTDPAALGFASFVPVAQLLATLPPLDTADVVLVLGAGSLGVERLLLTAAAPRMVAVVNPEDRRDEASLSSVLQRASALVIQARSEPRGRVIPINGNAGRTAGAPVGQAGA